MVIRQKKKENLTDDEIESGKINPEVSDNQGDRWSFVAVLPDTSFIHTIHHGKRTLEEAEDFVGEIKEKSDGNLPLISSDDWFYEKVLINSTGITAVFVIISLLFVGIAKIMRKL